jgi:CHASE2 domain-containing sensor protein
MRGSYRRDWTKTITYVFIIAFGAYSVLEPIVSVERAAPAWATTLLGLEFALSGILLLLGMGQRRTLRLIGLMVVSLGLFTISIVIALQGGTRVLAYAFLFAAFAMDSVHDIRVEKRAHREEPGLLCLLEELEAAKRERNDR